MGGQASLRAALPSSSMVLCKQVTGSTPLPLPPPLQEGGRQAPKAVLGYNGFCPESRGQVLHPFTPGPLSPRVASVCVALHHLLRPVGEWGMPPPCGVGLQPHLRLQPFLPHSGQFWGAAPSCCPTPFPGVSLVVVSLQPPPLARRQGPLGPAQAPLLEAAGTLGEGQGQEPLPLPHQVPAAGRKEATGKQGPSSARRLDAGGVGTAGQGRRVAPG